MKNSQVAMLCGAIIAAGIVVAGTNAWLVRSLIGRRARRPHRRAPAGAGGRRLVIAMMPKAKGDPYFVSCRVGAEEAARELGVELIWDGPTGLDAAKQNEVIENWITRKVDAIAVAVENRAGISTVLRKARERGIQRAHLGRRRGARRARLLRQSGDRRRHRQHAHRRGRAPAGRQRRVCDPHGCAERRQSERVDLVHQEARRRETSRPDARDRFARPTTTATKRLPRRRR